MSDVSSDADAERAKPLRGLLIEHGAAVDAAFKRAVRKALAQHKREGNPVAVWRDGKVTLLTPDEIPDYTDGEDD